MRRLNLASGTDVRPGWTNLDVVKQWPGAPPCDVIWDARRDAIPYPEASVDEIYAGYLLLHLAPMYHQKVLSEIWRVSKPDGKVVFGEVDMKLVMEHFLANPFDARTAELIWGEQGQACDSRPGEGWMEYAEFDKHCHGFTESSLVETLKRAGFADFARIKVHSTAVWYELTIQCRKVTA